MPSKLASHILDFDIDHYLNPWIPHNRLGSLPRPISHFLGYRKQEPQEPSVLSRWLSTLLGSFLGILITGAVYRYAPGIHSHHPPVIIASLGATAVLDYNAVRSPLAQPRNGFLGHALSAIVAVGISKLFQLNSNFVNLQWIAGAVACAVASLVMSMTNTVHPPGGATAVLAATSPEIIAMGWWFVPVVMVGTAIMFGVALLVNNVQRQFPVFWWTPQAVGRKLRRSKEESQQDVEKQEKEEEKEEAERGGSDASSQRTLNPGPEQQNVSSMFANSESYSITVASHQIKVPASLKLTEAETTLLEDLRMRLQQAHS